MFIRKLKRKNNKISLQIVKSYRDSYGKNQQEILRNIGTFEVGTDLDLGMIQAQNAWRELKQVGLLPFDSCDVAQLDQLPEIKEAVDTADEDKVCLGDLETEKVIDNGVKDIFGHIYSSLGMDNLLSSGKKQDYYNKILKDCVLMRINTPTSKRHLSELLLAERDLSIPTDKIYRLMDKLCENETSIKKKIYNSTLSAFKEKIDVAFFDVTTLYFESFTQDELKRFGFSKDCKFKEVQVVLALMATTDGMPLGYELFAGNTSEGKTLIECIKKFKADYEIQNIFLVADRAMFTEANLSYMEAEKINYIVAAKLKSQKTDLKNEILTFKKKALDIAKDRKLQDYTHEIKLKSGRRLIVSYSEKRANKDKTDRERLVARMKKYEVNGVIDIKKLIQNGGSKKWLKITGPTNTGVLNNDKIENEEKWDGLHGIIVNDSDIKIEDALERYKGLWQIEAAFRLNKNDLKMRPVFHWKPNRIKAHVLFCYICYTVVVNTHFKLKAAKINLSFAKAKEELSRVRASVVMNKKNGQKYLLPKTLNETQTKLYAAFGIPYSTLAQKID